jgi:hypothetical protein
MVVTNFYDEIVWTLPCSIFKIISKLPRIKRFAKFLFAFECMLVQHTRYAMRGLKEFHEQTTNQEQ